jgi:uncharacterized protein YfaP (DUF2135 family)
MAVLMVFSLVGLCGAITIDSPASGVIRDRQFNLSVKDSSELIRINYNGIPLIASAKNGFSRSMLAARGRNTITVSDYPAVWNSDTVTFYADTPPVALKIYLFWDTDHTDLDLHVIEPDGTECYYAHRDTRLGGSLDVDVTTGYGPEIYTMVFPVKGIYDIFVHFFGGEELTEATVVVVQDEGTTSEKRTTYQMMLTMPGDKIHVGKFEVR